MTELKARFEYDGANNTSFCKSTVNPDVASLILGLQNMVVKQKTRGPPAYQSVNDSPIEAILGGLIQLGKKKNSRGPPAYQSVIDSQIEAKRRLYVGLSNLASKRW